jgi:hypothetical protein
MLKIVRIKHDPAGKIIAYQLNDGRILSKAEAFDMVKDGEISGVVAGVDGYGERTISIQDGANRDIEIGKLPEIPGEITYVIRDSYKKD